MNKDKEIINYELSKDKETVFVYYANSEAKKLKVYHYNEEEKTILCDDFETYIKENDFKSLRDL